MRIERIPGVRGRRHIVRIDEIARGRVVWGVYVRHGVVPVVVLGDIVKVAA